MDGGPAHDEHVAYSDGTQGTGSCPKGFDRRLPGLLYETIVATDYFANRDGKFIFSNGDETGKALSPPSLSYQATLFHCYRY